MIKRCKKFYKEHKEGTIVGIIGTIGMIITYLLGKSSRMVHAVVVLVQGAEDGSDEKETEDD